MTTMTTYKVHQYNKTGGSHNLLEAGYFFQWDGSAVTGSKVILVIRRTTGEAQGVYLERTASGRWEGASDEGKVLLWDFNGTAGSLSREHGVVGLMENDTGTFTAIQQPAL